MPFYTYEHPKTKKQITIDGGTITDIVRQVTRSHEAVLQGLRKKIKPLIAEQYLRSINAVRVLQGLPQLQQLSEVPEDAPSIDVPVDENPGDPLDPTHDMEIIPDESLPGDTPSVPSKPTG